MPASTDPADQLRGGDPPVVVSTGAALIADSLKFLVTEIRYQSTEGKERIVLTMEEL